MSSQCFGCCGGVLLYGLWLGLIAGYSLTTFVAAAAVLRSDWHRVSKEAMERQEVLTSPGRGCASANHAADGSGGDAPPPCRATSTGGGGAACNGASTHQEHAPRRDGRAANGMAAPLLHDVQPPPALPPLEPVNINAEDAERWDLAD